MQAAILETAELLGRGQGEGGADAETHGTGPRLQSGTVSETTCGRELGVRSVECKRPCMSNPMAAGAHERHEHACQRLSELGLLAAAGRAVRQA